MVLHHVTVHKWCGSRRYTYPPQGWSLVNPRGGGGLKSQTFKEKYVAKMEIPGGMGVGGQWEDMNRRTIPAFLGEVWIFSEANMIAFLVYKVF